MGRDYTFSFKTAPYKPSISISPSNTYFASFNQNEIPRIVAKVVNANEVDYSLYKLKKEDLWDQVTDILTVGEFYELAGGEGSHIIFT